MSKTYRVTSKADRDMSLVNLPSDAIQDYWADVDASTEGETVGEFEVDERYAGFFERLLNNDDAVIKYTRK